MAIVHEIENPCSSLGVSESSLGKHVNMGQVCTGTPSAKFSTAAINTSGSIYALSNLTFLIALGTFGTHVTMLTWRKISLLF